MLLLPASLSAYSINVKSHTDIVVAQQLTFPKPEDIFRQNPDDNNNRVNEQGQQVDDQIDVEGQERQVTLPTGDLILDVLPRVLNWALFLMGTVLLIVLVYAGIQLLISRGDESRIDVGKRIIIDVIIGAVITGVAYALVTGLIITLQNL